jgi:hypothetical protein
MGVLKKFGKNFGTIQIRNFFAKLFCKKKRLLASIREISGKKST